MKTIVTLIGLTLLGMARAAATPALPATTIDSGQLQGQRLASGVQAWLGIPYAAPPVRQLRWQRTQSVAPWSGTYHADRTGPQS